MSTNVKQRMVGVREKLSEAQRWALLAAYNGDDTDWVHGNTINSPLRRGLIRWIDNGNAYANGRGGYITHPDRQRPSWPNTLTLQARPHLHRT